jgi:cysteine desulfurase/selenocysteine lyase
MSSPDRVDTLVSPVLPAGLPDPSVLARLAGEFLRALPGSSPPAAGSVPAAGGVPLPANPQPAGFTPPPGLPAPSTPAADPPLGLVGGPPPGANLLPSSPQSPANAAASAPSLVPHAQAPNGVPDHALVAAPGYDGRAGSYLLGEPRATAVDSPVSTPKGPGGGTPAAWSSGYYFLNDAPTPASASGLPARSTAAQDGLDALVLPSLGPAGLPGQDPLQALLRELGAGAQRPAGPAAPAAGT